MGYGNVTFTMATPLTGELGRFLLGTVFGLARWQRDFGPLRRISALHFAGFALVRPRLFSKPYVLFFSLFDGSAGAYLADFSALVPDYIDALWGKCVRYPGAREAEKFVNWLNEHALSDERGHEGRYEYHGYSVDVESAAAAPRSAELRRLAPMPLIESAIELMFRLEALDGGRAERPVTKEDILRLASEVL